MIGSEAVAYELELIPDEVRRTAIQEILSFIQEEVAVTEEITGLAEDLEKRGFQPVNALHLACALRGKADVFLTVDDRLYRKARGVDSLKGMRIANPVEWIRSLQGEEG